MIRTSATWKLSGCVASIDSDVVEGTVDCRHPDVGMQLAGGSKLFGLLPKSQQKFDELQECYIRGADLVATFQPVRPDEVSAQVYWRALAGDRNASGFEFILSMRSNKLESEPGVALICDLGSNVTEVERVEYPGLCIAQCNEKLSIAIMVHPKDYFAHEISERGGQFNLSYELFGASLEKGVIRRGRARFVVLADGSQIDDAIEQYRAFANSPTPLAT